MTLAIATTAPDNEFNFDPEIDLANLTRDELRAQFSFGIALTVKLLNHMALVMRRLGELGDDLSDLRGEPLLPVIRRISSGEVLAETYIQFRSKPEVFRSIAKTPPVVQKQLVKEDAKVEVMFRRDNGAFVKRLSTPRELQKEQLKQVFTPNGIRSESEQILYLEEKGVPAAPASTSSRVGSITPDRKRGGLKVGNNFLPIADVLAAVAELHPGLPSDVDEPKVSLTLKLSPIERSRLKMLEAKSGHSAQILIYRAVIAAGLLAQTDGTP